MLLHSIVFASRCARVQAEFLAAEAEEERPGVRPSGWVSGWVSGAVSNS